MSNIFTEKYRPKTLDDMILPDEYRAKFQTMIDTEKVPHLTLSSSTPGLGKTTLAKVLINELGLDVLWLNGSSERGIDTIKYNVQEFIGSVSILGEQKVVVIDEADALTESAQKILRGVIESTDAIFIFTCNYIDKLIPALINRTSIFDFDVLQDQPGIKVQAAKKLVNILDNEGVHYEGSDIKSIVQSTSSFRAMLLILQQSILYKQVVLDEGLLLQASLYDTTKLLVCQKDFEGLRLLVKSTGNINQIYNMFYQNIEDWSPETILIVAKYNEMSKVTSSAEICALAFLTEMIK